MDRVVFIGDELSAAGWRLAGLRVLTPEAGAEGAALAAARAEARMVLLSAEYAARIPVDTLDAALRARAPLMLVVPDVAGRVSPGDLGAELRAQLGMEP